MLSIIILILLLNISVLQSNCGFGCFINNMTINIPNITKKVLLWDLHLTNITCTNMEMYNIYSSIRLASIDIHLPKIGANCAINYKWGTFNGNVTANIGKGYMYFNIKLVKNISNGLVDRAKMADCIVYINMTTVKFSGDFYNWKIINGVIIELLESQLDTSIEKWLTNMINNNLTELFQNINKKITPYIENKLVSNSITNYSTVNFINNSIIVAVDYLINNLTSKHINRIINYLTNGTGIIAINNINTVYYNFLNIINTSLKIYNVSMILTQSFDYINILEPQTPIMLRNRLKMHNFYIIIPFEVKLDHDGRTSVEQFNFFSNIQNLSTDLNISLILNKSFLDTLNLIQIIDYGCLHDAIIDINTSNTGFNFNVSKINFTSTNPPTDFIYQFISIVNNAIILFINEYRPILPAFYMAYVIDPIMIYIDNYTLDCIEPLPILANDKSFYIILSFAISIVVIILVLFILMDFNMKKNEWKLLPHSNSDTSMLFNNDINIIMRGGILISIVINIFLFIYSNINIGASLYIKIFYESKKYIISPSLFNFSFFDSIRDMWNAKLYYIAILIFILSGVWPYIKLILMITCWIMPINRLQVKSRGHILEILDFLGKWSLIDIFLLIIMMCLFNIDVSVKSIIIKTFINAENGIHLFVLGVILSSIICHIILFFHNQSENKMKPDETYQQISFITKFMILDETEHILTTFGACILLGLWFISILLLLIGVSINSFSFEIEGYLAIILTYLESPIYESHSIISLIALLPYYSEYPNSFSIRWIQIFLFIFSIMLPLLFIIIICILLFYPLTKKYQQLLLSISEYARVLSIIEVFVLAIMISVLLLGNFVNFIVDDNCNYYISTHANWIVNIDKCFEVKTDFLIGFWILLFAIIIHIIISNILLSAFNYLLYGKKFVGFIYIIRICIFCGIIK